jgi:hypothetical protein
MSHDTVPAQQELIHNKHRKNVLKKNRKADILDVDVKKIKRLYRQVNGHLY